MHLLTPKAILIAMRGSILFILLLLAACAAGPAPRSLPRRAALRSCASATTTPSSVDFDPRIQIGQVAGVTWLFGYAAGEAVLAHLGASSELALTRVPLLNVLAAAIEGNRIWLYASGAGAAGSGQWMTVDVSQPDAPVSGSVVPVRVGAKSDSARAFAVGTGRALLITGRVADSQLVLIDTASRSAVRTPLQLGPGLLPTRAFCQGNRCAVVAVANEGDGPGRRLVVVRVAPDGAVEQEQLAPGWVATAQAVESRDGVIIHWADRQGSWLRALDLWGRPLGQAIHVSADETRIMSNDQLIAGERASLLAQGERAHWSVAPIGPGAVLGGFRSVLGAEQAFFLGAALADGLAWASISSDVSYDQLGKDGPWIHSWRARIVAGFVPASGREGALVTELAVRSGEGRGGLAPLILTRPRAAAVLIVPEGEAASSAAEAPRLFVLREACKTP